jgi:Flp pilus assembly protein TadD
MSYDDDPIIELLQQAELLVDVGRYPEAVNRAKDAARRAPDDARPYQLWSLALEGMGKYEEAARYARESIRLAPDDAMGHRLLSRAYSDLARSQRGAPRTASAARAVAAADEASRLDPYNPNSHLVLAEALAILGDVEQADAEIQLAIRAAPNSVATWVTASLVALGAKNWDAAIAACHRALAIDPNNYAALNNLGVALRACGRRPEGSKVLAKAARVSPDDLTARQNLSRAGVRTARLAVMVLLIPVFLVAHLGFPLYWVLAIGSNVLISRRPDLVLRVERWAVPIALLVAWRPSWRRAISSAAGGPRSESRDLTAQPWSATKGKVRFSYIFLFILAIAGAAVTVIMLALAATMRGDMNTVAFVALAAPFAGVTVWLALVLNRRRARA